MQHKKIIIPFSVALALASGLAIYFFFQGQQMEMALEKTQAKLRAADSIRPYQSLSLIDSLLFEGKYTEALQAYEAQLNDSNSLDANLEQRIKYTRKLLYQQRQLTQKIDSTDTVAQDTLMVARTATPEELRQYDSLQFALAKSKVQVQNLKRQLQQKALGEYLVFNTRKGNKVHYVGEVKNEKANGEGIALFETGSRYEGMWKNNMRHGKGTFYWPDGEYYIGEYSEDQRSGKGTYYWANGEKFTGQWADDQRNGKGTFYGKEGEIIAQGTWKDDELVNVEK